MAMFWLAGAMVSYVALMWIIPVLKFGKSQIAIVDQWHPSTLMQTTFCQAEKMVPFVFGHVQPANSSYNSTTKRKTSLVCSLTASRITLFILAQLTDQLALMIWRQKNVWIGATSLMVLTVPWPSVRITSLNWFLLVKVLPSSFGIVTWRTPSLTSPTLTKSARSRWALADVTSPLVLRPTKFSSTLCLPCSLPS